MMVQPISKNDYPDWLVTAIPGAVAAREQWKGFLSEAEPLQAAHQAALAARRGKVAYQGEPGSAILVPAAHVSTSEFDRLNSVVRSTKSALEAHGREARAYRAKFDAIVRHPSVAADELQAIAAGQALANHDRATDAWKVLRSALADRDQAYRHAGMPGREWSTNDGVSHNVLNERSRAELYFEAAISAYDVEAMRAVADKTSAS
jgi:hypothetical protein